VIRSDDIRPGGDGPLCPSSTPSLRRLLFTAFALLLVGLALRGGPVLISRFDGLYGQDAYYFYEEGRHIAFSFRHDGLDSVGYPGLLALTFLLFGVTPAVAQSAGLLLGALTPVGVFGIGWLLTKRYSTAFIAGILTCALPFHIRSSIVIMSDVSALFWITAGVWSGLRYLDTLSWRWGLSAVCLIALAGVTRYVSFLILIPLIVCAFASHRRIPINHLAVGFAVGLAVCVPELLRMRVHIPSLFILKGWSPWNAVQREFITPDGFMSYPMPVALMNMKTLGGWSFLNPVGALAALTGLWRFRRDTAAAAFLVSWLAVWFVFLSGLTVVNPRYLLPLSVPLCLLSAMGLMELAEKIGGKRRYRNTALIGLVGLTLAGMGFGVWRTVGEILERKACEMEAVQWVREHTDATSAVLIAFDVAHALRHYTERTVTHLHEIQPEKLDIPSGDEPGFYLIWNEEHALRVARRRPGEDDIMPSFAENVRWLREEVRRTGLTRICGWEILRLNRP
jgi:4-amino-4-deoxy-L-arabinose transferase-like glycosyltransferase